MSVGEKPGLGVHLGAFQKIENAEVSCDAQTSFLGTHREFRNEACTVAPDLAWFEANLTKLSPLLRAMSHFGAGARQVGVQTKGGVFGTAQRLPCRGGR